MANASKVIMSSGDAPATPGTGTVALYAKADGIFYYKADDGETIMFVGDSGDIYRADLRAEMTLEELEAQGDIDRLL